MKQFFLILSGLALLTGCSSKNDSVEGPVQSRIRIAPSISRVTGLNFDTGDRIGLTIVKSGANYCENTPLRFDGTVFVSDDLFWYDDPSEKSNLTAYYPYLAEGAPASFTVRADQKLAADHEASDLLAATATDVVPSQTAVNMVFTHLLTKIVIDITNNSANTIEEVTLKGSRCTATVDLSAKSVQVDASSAETDIYPFPTVTAGRYEAILVPQRAALELEIQTSDGNRHTKTFQATDLQSGAEYAIEAVISNTNKIHASNQRRRQRLGGRRSDRSGRRRPAGRFRPAGVRRRQVSHPATQQRYDLDGGKPALHSRGQARFLIPVRRKRHLVSVYDLLYRIQRHGIHPTARFALRSGYGRRGNLLLRTTSAISRACKAFVRKDGTFRPGRIWSRLSP